MAHTPEIISMSDMNESSSQNSGSLSENSAQEENEMNIIPRSQSKKTLNNSGRLSNNNYYRRDTKLKILTHLQQKISNNIKQASKGPTTRNKRRINLFAIPALLHEENTISCNEKFKRQVNYIMDMPAFIIIMSVLTLFALFGSDIQTAWCPPTVDLAFDIIQWFIFCSFMIEIILCSYVDDSYFGSLFFVLDLVSTLSLFLDVNFISDKFLSQNIFQGNTKFKTQLALNKISTASGTTRVLRIWRIVKLIRVVKLYKSVYQTKMAMDKNEELKKKKIKMLLKSSSSSKSLAELTTPETVDMNNKNSSRVATDAYMCTIGNNSDAHNFTEQMTIQNEINWNGRKLNIDPSPRRKSCKMLYPWSIESSGMKGDIGKIKNIEDASDEISKESKISRIWTDRLNKKIFCWVLIVLVIYPFISEDFFSTDERDQNSYAILANYFENYWVNHRDETFARVSGFYIAEANNPFFPLINITLNGKLYYKNEEISRFNYRQDEIRTYISSGTTVEVTYSNYKETTMTAALNFGRTWFVCFLVTVSIYVIEGDTKENVWEPLEVMMEIVENVSKDPAGAKNKEDILSGTKAIIDRFGKENKWCWQENNYEIKIIKQAIIKISGLLAMGFGKIGSRIIKLNLANDDFKLYDTGQIIAGVHVRYSLKNYLELNYTLRKKSIILLNQISEYIHNSIDLLCGCVTKNTGQDVISIWKFNNNETHPLTSPKNNEKNANYLNGNTNLELPVNHWECFAQWLSMMESVSDWSIFSCLHIYHKLKKKANLLYNKYKIKLTMSLHLGLSVEGVVGSQLKVDTMHISENTNICKLLNDAAGYYGVIVLFTDSLFQNNSTWVQQISRHIDTVKFPCCKQNKLYRIYTIDLNKNIQPSNKSSFLLNKAEKEILMQEKKRKWYEGINVVGNVAHWMLWRESIKETIDDSPKTEEFYNLWATAMNYYEKGWWKKAKKWIDACLKIDSTDTPGERWLEYMKENRFEAPEDWDGGRKFPIDVNS